MPITSANIKLLASQRMTDTEDGGGQMAGAGLQDGEDNNVFQDISSTDFAFGRLSLMKVWPSVQSSNTDRLLGAHVILEAASADPNVGAFIFAGTGPLDERADAVERLQQTHWTSTQTSPFKQSSNQAGVVHDSASGVAPAVGMVLNGKLVLAVTSVGGTGAEFPNGSGGTVAPPSGAAFYEVTSEPAMGTGASGVAMSYYGPALASPRLYGCAAVTGTLASGDVYCDVDSLLVPVVPKAAGAAAGAPSQIGIDGTAVVPAGKALAFRGGDGLVIHHTAEVSAATYANGNTVNMGRTNLSKVRPVGANGRTITTGWTVNLSTGVATVVDISGWSQPVVWKHTIEEVLACARTGYPDPTGGAATLSSPPITLGSIAGGAWNVGQANATSIRVLSRAGVDITDLTYTANASPFSQLPLFGVNLAAGTVTYAPSGAITEPALSGLSAAYSPVTLVSTRGSSSAVLAQPTPNRLTFNRPLTRAFPSGTRVSSMLLLGDLQARAGQSFAQESWGNVWSDTRIGSAIAAQYQQAANPIVVTNQGAVTERWAIIFTSTTQFRLVGESLGQIATGDVNSAFAPVNPATGVPYFTIAAAGWGTWANGNVLRLNTYGANAPMWMARSVLPSAPTSTPNSILVAVRGDIDA